MWCALGNAGAVPAANANQLQTEKIMDMYCSSCGEPWDMDYVIHDEPDEFTRCESKISKCPACPTGNRELTPAQKNTAAIANALSDLLGDDIDGFCSEMDDAIYLGI